MQITSYSSSGNKVQPGNFVYCLQSRVDSVHVVFNWHLSSQNGAFHLLCPTMTINGK